MNVKWCSMTSSMLDVRTGPMNRVTGYCLDSSTRLARCATRLGCRKFACSATRGVARWRPRMRRLARMGSIVWCCPVRSSARTGGLLTISVTGNSCRRRFRKSWRAVKQQGRLRPMSIRMRWPCSTAGTFVGLTPGRYTSMNRSMS